MFERNLHIIIANAQIIEFNIEKTVLVQKC